MFKKLLNELLLKFINELKTNKKKLNKFILEPITKNIVDRIFPYIMTIFIMYILILVLIILILIILLNNK